MNSLVTIEDISKEVSQTLVSTHNIVTNDGDIYYAKKAVGEDTSGDFPNLYLELGRDGTFPPSTAESYDPFEDNSGVVLLEFNGNADDTSGNFNGTWYGTENYQETYLQYGAVFDGSSAVCLGTAKDIIDNNTDFSITLHLKLDEIENGIRIFGTEYNNGGFWLGIENDKLTAIIGDGTDAGNNTKLEVDIPDFSDFVFLALQWSSADENISLVVNEKVKDKAKSAWSYADDTVPFVIGADATASDDCANFEKGIKGTIDEFRIFNKTLTDSELTTIREESYKKHARKDSTGVRDLITRIPLKMSYAEDFTTFTYKFTLLQTSSALDGEVVKELAITNGDDSDPKAINHTILYPEDYLTLQEGSSHLFTVKHAVYFPATEDNFYTDVNQYPKNGEFGLYNLTYAKLPDVDKTEQPCYFIEAKDSLLSKDNKKYFTSKLKDIRPNTFLWVAYKLNRPVSNALGCQEPINGHGQFNKFTDWNTVLDWGFTDKPSLDNIALSDDATVVFHTNIKPFQTGYWWFYADGGTAQECYINGDLVSYRYSLGIADYGEEDTLFVPYMDFPAEGYRWLLEGQVYTFTAVVQHIKDLPTGYRNELIVKFQEPLSRDSFFRPFDRMGTFRYFDYFYDKWVVDEDMLKTPLSLRYPPMKTTVNSSNYIVFYNPVFKGFIIKFLSPVSGDVVPLRLSSEFWTDEKTFVKMNDEDVPFTPEYEGIKQNPYDVTILQLIVIRDIIEDPEKPIAAIPAVSDIIEDPEKPIAAN